MEPDRDAAAPADSDQRLVAAVRRGDDRAFEVLYHRYQRRIHAYVLGMVGDHGRAEDVTQEVFVSALRRMRETEQPLAFKPWLYQIAKNSCIDAFRRSKRAEEVSYDSDDGLTPGDHSKLIGSGPSPDAAVAAKQDLDNLCGAFGGLSETHHEILVLRELEGLSYLEIGKRMGMSRPAVESTLFRARRRLTEEYDDIVSGARCHRVQGIIVTAAQSQLGSRDARRLARHLSYCQACRREALAAGIDRGLLTRPSVRERIASRVAGLLPFPAFVKLRRGADEAAASVAPSGRGAHWASQLPMLSDHLSSGWGKAAAGAAVLAAGVGVGTGVDRMAGPPERPAPIVRAEAPKKPASSRVAVTPQEERAPKTPAATAAPREARGDKSAGKRSSKPERKRGSGNRVQESGPPSAGRRDTPRGGGDDPAPQPTQPDSNPSSASSPNEPAKDRPEPSSGSKRDPKPAVNTPAVPTATPPANPVGETVTSTTGAVDGAIQGTTDGVDKVVQGVTGGGPVSDTIDGVTDVADNVVDSVTDVLDGVTHGVVGALGGITGRRGG